MARRDIVTIGASAGGVEALMTIARSFPADFPAAVFIVLHMVEANFFTPMVVGERLEISPLAILVPYVATGPVLVFIGFLMIGLIRDIDFSDIEEGFPALLGLMLMPLTFSITVGIGAAFIAYVVIKVVRGKATEVHPLMWVVAIAFVIYFLQNWLNATII
mgnify:CR=1 FL=1